MKGDQLPEMITTIPGPRSTALAKELRSVECRAITYIDDSFPVFWEAARGSNVLDVDGNLYIDASGAFAVSNLGHSADEVVEALQQQAASLLHGMGDVHPSAAKVEVAKLLDEITPGDLGHAIFGSSGAEAVEAAIKTATLATGRPGLIAFEGAYHGLTYGALAATHRKDFRQPFEDQLGVPVVHLPFPDPYRPPAGSDASTCSDFCLQRVRETLESSQQTAAVIIEPIQGRGGEVVPPEDFLPGLRKVCDESGVLLICDEIFTGFCRTGEWFAADHAGVVPDLMCLGKALSNGFPVSACVGRPQVMDAWAESTGEAIHTSTYLGHPVGCAMGIATIRQMQRLKLDRTAAEKGEWLMQELRALSARHERIGNVRGKGLMVGVELVKDRSSKEPDSELTWKVVQESLRRGLILLGGGRRRNVLSISPPLTIAVEQLEFLVDTLDDVLGTT